MTPPEVVFWVSAGLIGYTYAGFPLALAALSLLRRRKLAAPMEEWPFLSILVVAHNEEASIERKIKNILSCDYPSDKIEVIVCSDGSTDRTDELVRSFGDPRVSLAATGQNLGVNEAFGYGAALARGNLLLLTDSGGLFEPDALEVAIRHFGDPSVGCVNGLFDHVNPGGRAVARGYRSYWRVETLVKLWESRLGVACVIVGAFEVIRRELYRVVPSHLSNDMAVPMELHHRGFRTVYEPRAVISAPQVKSGEQEFRRRVRVAVRAWTSLPYIASVAPPIRSPVNWLVLISHKYFRWLSGLMFGGLFLSNLFLAGGAFYQVTLAAQATLLISAAAGAATSAAGRGVPALLAVPYWLVVVWAAGVWGLVKALRGSRVATWKADA